MTFVQPFAVFADVMTSSNAFAVDPDYLIGSGSNADPYGLITLELDDDDFNIMPLSSLGTVANTLIPNKISVRVIYYDVNEVRRSYYVFAEKVNDRYRFNCILPQGSIIDYFEVQLFRSDGALPAPGNYNLSFDLGSDFSYTYSQNPNLYYVQTKNNVNREAGNLYPTVNTYSGDIYMPPYGVNLGSVDGLYVVCRLKMSEATSAIGGDFAFNFTRSSNSGVDVGFANSSEDYQSDVSGSLSNISSSIGDMSESLDSAAENLEYISTSQNLIIQGIDNVIMHISDQLYAFWDQLYNLIHEPTYARLGDILDAIRNLDLEITVEMTEVTNAVNKMNQEVQNKLQQTTDKITGGYDSSVLESENQQIQSAVDEYDQSEQAILDSVEGNIEDFTYPSFDDLPLGTLGALGFFGGLMQSIFEGMGAFNMIITFSLTLVFVLILIGYHRIRN